MYLVYSYVFIYRKPQMIRIKLTPDKAFITDNDPQSYICLFQIQLDASFKDLEAKIIEEVHEKVFFSINMVEARGSR